MDYKDDIDYIIVFNNGNYLERDSLENTEHLEGIFMIVKRSYYTEHTTSNGFFYVYHKFDTVDKQGKSIIVDCVWFTIETLGKEGRVYGSESAIRPKIFDKNTHELRELRFKTYAGGTAVFTRITNYLQNLKKVGSWEGFEIQQENITLQKKIEDLERRITDLESKKLE